MNAPGAALLIALAMPAPAGTPLAPPARYPPALAPASLCDLHTGVVRRL